MQDVVDYSIWAEAVDRNLEYDGPLTQEFQEKKKECEKGKREL